MKVIDLLNKIANGEDIPKRIQVYSDIFVFDNSNMVYEHEKTRTNLLNIYNGYILNYEVIIREEDKGISKDIKWYLIDFQEEEKTKITQVNMNFKLLREKLVEIIDKINELEK